MGAPGVPLDPSLTGLQALPALLVSAEEISLSLQMPAAGPAGLTSDVFPTDQGIWQSQLLLSSSWAGWLRLLRSLTPAKATTRGCQD